MFFFLHHSHNQTHHSLLHILLHLHLHLHLHLQTHSHISMAKETNNENTNTQPQQPPWQELLGSKKWQGLLNPLNNSLLNLILHCGDLTQATYDTFISDDHSPYCGASRYNTSDLLNRVFFPSFFNYTIPSFLYATSQISLPSSFLLFSLSRESWSKESNWMGFIAVSSDSYALSTGRREIYVAFRGTIRDLEWLDVVQPLLTSVRPLLSTSAAQDDDDDPKIMKGWYTIYTSSDPKSPFSKASARCQLLSKIKQLVQLYKDEALSIVCVGHSLGASLAILSAFDIVENGLSKIENTSENFPVCAVVFGSPQIGNKAFNDRLEKLPMLNVLHVKNKIDMVPIYPSRVLGYVYSGVELVVDARKSPFLKDSKNPSDWHNLQGILHAVAGWNGEDGEFEMKVKRSVGLVNKSSEYLKDECLIPGSWWVEKNKGVVLGEDGEWKVEPLSEDDVPVPPSVEDIDLSFNTPEIESGEIMVAKVMKKKKQKKNRCGAGLPLCCSFIPCLGSEE
ncbi:phospholipase A1-IIdelta [Dioscorea cayenensis subsp. rotundata]|uniref:Phospholipase A1 n=1 Tax=Dioscorea cayennensis subsp. rotundata TaxID=55577 RepID=A0AB40ANF1_DIOCR|nr:phospholipase A1-IIdelta [Dioscorea cayenensis subsp. rotundata]